MNCCDGRYINNLTVILNDAEGETRNPIAEARAEQRQERHHLGPAVLVGEAEGDAEAAESPECVGAQEGGLRWHPAREAGHPWPAQGGHRPAGPRQEGSAQGHEAVQLPARPEAARLLQVPSPHGRHQEGSQEGVPEAVHGGEQEASPDEGPEREGHQAQRVEPRPLQLRSQLLPQTELFMTTTYYIQHHPTTLPSHFYLSLSQYCLV